MPKWQTDVEVKTSTGELARIPITFRRGLYQGDSLSLLLFCLSVALISHKLRENGGFDSEFQHEPFTHMFLMDDLKLYAKSKSQLETTVRTVESVSDANWHDNGHQEMHCGPCDRRKTEIKRRPKNKIVNSHQRSERGRIVPISGGGTTAQSGTERNKAKSH